MAIKRQILSLKFNFKKKGKIIDSKIFLISVFQEILKTRPNKQIKSSKNNFHQNIL